jgi:hypothetical protein
VLLDERHVDVLQQLSSSAESPLTPCNPNDPRVLGNDEFIGRLLTESWRPRSRLTLNDLIEKSMPPVQRDPAITSIRRPASPTHRVRTWITHEVTTLRIAPLRTFHRNEASLRQSVQHHFPRNNNDGQS